MASSAPAVSQNIQCNVRINELSSTGWRQLVGQPTAALKRLCVPNPVALRNISRL